MLVYVIVIACVVVIIFFVYQPKHDHKTTANETPAEIDKSKNNNEYYEPNNINEVSSVLDLKNSTPIDSFAQYLINNTRRVSDRIEHGLSDYYTGIYDYNNSLCEYENDLKHKQNHLGHYHHEELPYGDSTDCNANYKFNNFCSESRIENCPLKRDHIVEERKINQTNSDNFSKYEQMNVEKDENEKEYENRKTKLQQEDIYHEKSPAKSNNENTELSTTNKTLLDNEKVKGIEIMRNHIFPEYKRELLNCDVSIPTDRTSFEQEKALLTTNTVINDSDESLHSKNDIKEACTTNTTNIFDFSNFLGISTTGDVNNTVDMVNVVDTENKIMNKSIKYTEDKDTNISSAKNSCNINNSNSQKNAIDDSVTNHYNETKISQEPNKNISEIENQKNGINVVSENNDSAEYIHPNKIAKTCNAQNNTTIKHSNEMMLEDLAHSDELKKPPSSCMSPLDNHEMHKSLPLATKINEYADKKASSYQKNKIDDNASIPQNLPLVGNNVQKDVYCAKSALTLESKCPMMKPTLEQILEKKAQLRKVECRSKPKQEKYAGQTNGKFFDFVRKLKHVEKVKETMLSIRKSNNYTFNTCMSNAAGIPSECLRQIDPEPKNKISNYDVEPVRKGIMKNETVSPGIDSEAYVIENNKTSADLERNLNNGKNRNNNLYETNKYLNLIEFWKVVPTNLHDYINQSKSDFAKKRQKFEKYSELELNKKSNKPRITYSIPLFLSRMVPLTSLSRGSTESPPVMVEELDEYAINNSYFLEFLKKYIRLNQMNVGSLDTLKVKRIFVHRKRKTNSSIDQYKYNDKIANNCDGQRLAVYGDPTHLTSSNRKKLQTWLS